VQPPELAGIVAIPEVGGLHQNRSRPFAFQQRELLPILPFRIATF
jgi:hypothetical protein